MSTIRLRIPELNIIKRYAEFNNKSLSEIILTKMLEKIEDEYDFQVFA